MKEFLWASTSGRVIRYALVLGLIAPVGAAAQSAVADTARPRVAATPAAAEPDGTTAPAAVAVVAGSNGFGLRSADGDFAIRFQGLAQYDGRYFADDVTGNSIDGFDLRRLRGDLRGTVYGIYDFRAHLEYAGNRVDVLDAYLDARFHPAFQLRVGKFKSPVGLERLQSSAPVLFAERGFPSSLLPNRDVGVQIHGGFGGTVATYALGVFNGAADGASGDGDVSDSKDIAARLFFHPFAGNSGSPLRGLGFGVAAAIGDQSGSAAAPALPSPRTTIGRTTFLRFRGDGSPEGTVIASGRRTRISPQAYWYLGPLGLLAEYARSETRVALDQATTDLVQTAWQVTGSWVLTGEAASYRGVTPATPFDPANGGWGAWEVAVRAQQLGADSDAFPLLANPAQSSAGATSYTVGVNAYLNRAVRFLINYERTSFDQAAGGIDRPAEGVFVSRFQVAF